jgi:hypothetical protein
MKRVALLLFLALIVCMVPASADPFTFSWFTGDASVDDMGNNYGASDGIYYDTFTLTGMSPSTMTLSWAEIQTVAVNSTAFAAGPSCFGSGLGCPNNSGFISRDLTVNGITKQLINPWNIDIESSDILYVGQGNTVAFDLGSGAFLKVTPLAATFGPNDGTSIQNGFLEARFSVPEPSSLLMLGAMLLGLAGSLKLKLR